MPTITFDISDADAAAILAVTKESAQAFLERNARAHVSDCVSRQKVITFAARGVPSQVAVALEADELEALAQIREAKAAAIEAERVASLAPK